MGIVYSEIYLPSIFLQIFKIDLAPKNIQELYFNPKAKRIK